MVYVDNFYLTSVTFQGMKMCRMIDGYGPQQLEYGHFEHTHAFSNLLADHNITGNQLIIKKRNEKRG